jgi:hypothetical protein
MLTEQNFLNFAMKNYDNIHCKTLDEFNEDLNKILYIKKLLNRMIDGDIVNLRLVLNHLIIFYNVFKSDAATAMLFFKMEQDKWQLLNTFLIFLNYCPVFIESLGVNTDTIGYHNNLLTALNYV